METLADLFSLSLPTFFIMFSSIYVFAYLILFRNWGPKHRAEASSSFISLAHGTPAVIMATYAITIAQKSQGSLSLATPNTIPQDTVLEFSIAYFLMDLLHYIIFIPYDILFILHHVATLYVFVTCRYVVHYGAFELLVLLILAEMTSPCQNLWSLARFRRAHVPACAKFYDFLSPPFYSFYSLVRGILGPLFVYKMWVFYLSGAAHNLIPKWAWLSWMVVIVAAIFLSILWVLNNWNSWLGERGYRARKKVS